MKNENTVQVKLGYGFIVIWHPIKHLFEFLGFWNRFHSLSFGPFFYKLITLWKFYLLLSVTIVCRKFILYTKLRWTVYNNKGHFKMSGLNTMHSRWNECIISSEHTRVLINKLPCLVFKKRLPPNIN